MTLLLGKGHHYFRPWRLDGTWERLHEVLRDHVRTAAGHRIRPSAAIIDSQSVRTTEGGPRGYDAGKKVTGRNRHIIVVTLRLFLAVVVHPANLPNREGARSVLAVLLDRFPRLWVIWADGNYAGTLLLWELVVGGWVIELVKRPDRATGWVTLPTRWVVERMFAWLGRCRRLSKDDEALPATSETRVRVAMIHLFVKRLAPLCGLFKRAFSERTDELGWRTMGRHRRGQPAGCWGRGLPAESATSSAKWRVTRWSRS